MKGNTDLVCQKYPLLSELIYTSHVICQKFFLLSVKESKHSYAQYIIRYHKELNMEVAKLELSEQHIFI